MEYYDEFAITEIEKGPVYDGYTPDDVTVRLNSLPLIGDSYIKSGKNIIANTNNQISTILSETPGNDIDSEKVKRLTNL
jgi:hypothetical protein